MEESKELRLSVPWGHVAAKAWGSSTDFPVLCVHGLLDNAGAFDRLISQLPKNYYYISIDLPGHGLSSHFPPGVPINLFDYVLTLRYILEELKWKSFYYMGHSLGGQIGTFYSILYPDQIQKMVLIEGIVPFLTSDEKIVPKLRKLHDEIIKAQDDTNNKLYTFDEIMYSLKYRRRVCLNTPAAEAIFKRSVSKCNELFKYNRDHRLKFYTKPFFNASQMLAILSTINTKSITFFTHSTLDNFSDEEKFLMKTAFENINNFNAIYIDGNHDVHNNYPERISGYISKFFNNIAQMSTKMKRKSAATLNIKVPWGHIAAKTWGDHKNTPVLVVHGIMDNAGSFDRLIAQLPENMYYVCIDLPGHGLSTHFEPGTQLNYFNYVLAIRYVLDELQWEQVYYLSHSLGAHVGVYFSLLYPERVKKLILIDGFVPQPVSNNDLIKTMKIYLQLTVDAYKLKSPRQYSKEDVMYAFKNLRMCALNSEAANAIFERSVTKVGDDSYCYNRDFRLKYGLVPYMNKDQHFNNYKHLKVETLLILTTDSLWFLKPLQPDIIDLFKDFNNVKIITVQGNHDVHNNYPERISEHISKFLMNIPNSKL